MLKLWKTQDQKIKTTQDLNKHCLQYCIFSIHHPLVICGLHMCVGVNAAWWIQTHQNRMVVLHYNACFKVYREGQKAAQHTPGSIEGCLSTGGRSPYQKWPWGLTSLGNLLQCEIRASQLITGCQITLHNPILNSLPEQISQSAHSFAKYHSKTLQHFLSFLQIPPSLPYGVFFYLKHIHLFYLIRSHKKVAK